MSDVELDRWHGEPVSDRARQWGVPALRVFRRVGSTNDIAAAMAVRGAEAGTVVVAEEQTAGRGRRGRVWSAPAGCSLSLSMVLRPDDPDAGRLLTLRLGLAAARALESLHPLRVGIKWPNDLEIEGRKVAGILCEADVHGGAVRHVVAGIGVNVAQRPDDWPAELRDRATSLAAAGADRRTDEVADAVVRAWLDAAAVESARLTAEEVARLAARDVLRGRVVRVDGRMGTASGITETGSLRVVEDGAATEVVAGTVRIQDGEGLT